MGRNWCNEYKQELLKVKVLCKETVVGFLKDNGADCYLVNYTSSVLPFNEHAVYPKSPQIHIC